MLASCVPHLKHRLSSFAQAAAREQKPELVRDFESQRITVTTQAWIHQDRSISGRCLGTLASGDTHICSSSRTELANSFICEIWLTGFGSFDHPIR